MSVVRPRSVYGTPAGLRLFSERFRKLTIVSFGVGFSLWKEQI